MRTWCSPGTAQVARGARCHCATDCSVALIADGTDLTGQSSAWSTGDIINKSGKGGSGHIVIIYDVFGEPDGRHRIQFMESAGSAGVRETTVWFDEAEQQWQSKSGRVANWPPSSATVTRPKPFVT